MEEITESSLVNRRIVCNESFGTIRYVGTLEGVNQDIWYGIEWDDNNRGKHDGSFKGKRYFHTKHPNSGSFVKPDKVDLGCNIYEAAKEKYLSNDENSKDNENIEELLYDSSRLIERLSCVSLASCKISSTNSIDLFKNTFKYVKEIDLDSNLFDSWEQIFFILDNLKLIKLLNVSNNRLRIPSNNNNEHVYENLNYLILNRMNCTWTDVLEIVKYFPSLTQLKVCYNELTRIDDINENLSKNLKILDLESNNLNDWKNILKLGELKELEHLYVNNNGIKKIYFDDVQFNGQSQLFPKIKTMALNYNKIDNWNSINEFQKLRNLEELRFVGNPLNDTDRATNIREFFLAKIKKLKLLNRSPINNNERQGAEIDYLKKFCKEYLSIKDFVGQEKYEEFMHAHPRFLELIEKYGLPEISEISVKPDTVKSSLISVNIVNDITKDKVVRKLPLSITIQRLKGVVFNLFVKSGFEKDSIKLIYISEKKLGDSYELENEFRDLKFYSVEDGDTIIAKMV